jgi:hypothetical protein
MSPRPEPKSSHIELQAAGPMKLTVANDVRSNRHA